MELCDLNLESWILRKWDEETEKKLPYLTGNLPSRMRIGQIWDAMEDITRAVAYIHSNKEIHRDLKPCNSKILRLHTKLMTFLVLYSLQDQVWKIADFGLTTEGTSNLARTTHYSRGTPSYRAPELIRDVKYTNKVDIWAIGCILYELIFKTKAFPGDGAVLLYAHENMSSGHTLPLPFKPDTVPDKAREAFLSKIILRMLNIDANSRPAAQQLYKRFISWGRDESPVSATASQKSTIATSNEEIPSELPSLPSVQAKAQSRPPAESPLVGGEPNESRVDASTSPNSAVPTSVVEATLDPSDVASLGSGGRETQATTSHQSIQNVGFTKSKTTSRESIVSQGISNFSLRN